jgi:hypothetical protein
MRIVLAGVALAQIRVLSPQALVSDLPHGGQVIGTTATFGVPYYAERLVGQLKYGASMVGDDKAPHCTDGDYDIGPLPDPQAPSEYGGNGGAAPILNIVIVRRGGCTFVTKVRVAQEAKGAHAVIIVDQESSSYTSETIQNLIVADDGYGEQVKIPSILVAKEEGRKLIQAVQRGGMRDPVVVELGWDIPVNKIVTLDMWLSSASDELSLFIKEFAPIRESLGWNLAFAPHYHIYSLQSDYSELCWDHDGAYCTDDPDGPGPVTGKNVLEEDVRQLCILENTLQSDPRGESPALYSTKFWKYLSLFQERCPVRGETPATRFGKVCGTQVMEEVLSSTQIDTVKSCELTTHKQKLDQHRSNRAWSPRAVRINGWRYAGPIEADTITRAICSGYIEKPAKCAKMNLRTFVSEFDDENSISFVNFVLIIGLILAAAFVALKCYRRMLTTYVRSSIREEVMLEVKHQMTDYAPLRDT